MQDSCAGEAWAYFIPRMIKPLRSRMVYGPSIGLQVNLQRVHAL
jgi:hypothetical protein